MNGAEEVEEKGGGKKVEGGKMESVSKIGQERT